MTKSSFHPKYRPDIDGLRAIAVMSVVLYHAFPNSLRGGFAGVDVFFVISGFLISTILFQNIERGTFSIADFYSRRIRRIFPALGLVLFSVLIFGWFCLFPDELQQLGKHTATTAGFFQNFTLWREAGYFDNANETKPLLHIWSLGIEEQFYFVWPLLLWSAAKAGEKGGSEHIKRFCFLLVTLLVFVVSLILNLSLIKTDPTKTFYLPQYRFFELAAGGILSWLVLYHGGQAHPPSDSENRGLRCLFTDNHLKNVLSFLGFGSLLTVFVLFNKETEFPGKNALYPVFSTALIIFAGSQSWINKKVLSHKMLVWIGLISYPLYLWHWPVLSFSRIIYGESPPLLFRWSAIAFSIVASSLTVQFIEKPFRFGNSRVGLKVTGLLLTVFGIGIFGHFVKRMDFTQTHNYQKIAIKRKGFDFRTGYSVYWYEGKQDWLFLGNAYDRTVDKLKLATKPSEEEIEKTSEPFVRLAEASVPFNTRVVLMIGPNKESIYPEFLPDELIPSPKKYIHFFLERLRGIPHLTVYDPTDDLIRLKKTEGILYLMTDTHWNDKGAFLAFRGFAHLLKLPVPEVEFQHSGQTHPGDLIGIGKLNNFPLHPEDNWEVLWKKKPEWTEKELPNEQDSSFAKPTLVTNSNSLSQQRVWVVGDSFANGLKKYFNATFKEVRYIGHWSHKLKDLSNELVHAKEKPDLIVVVRVERTF